MSVLLEVRRIKNDADDDDNDDEFCSCNQVLSRSFFLITKFLLFLKRYKRELLIDHLEEGGILLFQTIF